MDITDIKIAKKDRNRVHIYADNEYIGTLYIDYVIDGGIKIGTPLDLDTFNKLLNLSNTKKLLNQAMGYVAIRLRSEKEILDYINKKAFKQKLDTTKINYDEILFKLKNYGFVDDEKFCLAWINTRILKGVGPHKLKMELIQKGIDKNIIENSLHDIEEDISQESIAKLSEKYLRNKTFKSENEKKWKLKQYLASKGF